MYILDRFRELRATQLTLRDIIGDCTLNRFQALWNALLELEFQHGLLRQQTDAEIFELTPPAIGKMGLEFLPQTRGRAGILRPVSPHRRFPRAPPNPPA